MKTLKESYLWVSFSISIAVLLLCFASIVMMPAFSATSDTFNLSVTIGNYQPNVTSVTFADYGGGTIQLSAAGDTLITCNGSLVDPNGGGDISNGSAKLWKVTNSSDSGALDNNTKYENTSCTLETSNGNYRNITCGFVLPYYVMNGTWVCNVSVQDATGVVGSNLSNPNNTVDQLNAVDVLNQTVSFGSMSIGESSAAPGRASNVSNLGNVKINISVASATAAMSCSEQGDIGVGNISYNVTSGSRAALAKNLTTSAVNVDSFKLGARGIATVDALNATKNVYWGITIPTGVKGTCQNNITVTSSVAD